MMNNNRARICFGVAVFFTFLNVGTSLECITCNVTKENNNCKSIHSKPTCAANSVCLSSTYEVMTSGITHTSIVKSCYMKNGEECNTFLKNLEVQHGVIGQKGSTSLFNSDLHTKGGQFNFSSCGLFDARRQEDIKKPKGEMHCTPEEGSKVKQLHCYPCQENGCNMPDNGASSMGSISLALFVINLFIVKTLV